ncbi:MAG: divergent PAP2 family protein [Peptostreptococcaceae bacterium]|nr:divergent PAP2 family protein [Peptostreptococcaceae bacterium]
MNVLLSNYVLLAAAASWTVAQITKIIYYSIKSKHFTLKYFLSSGGFPSSHSATVTSLAASCAITLGIGSPAFAITTILASVVIYDSVGVRQTTGRLSASLNMLQLSHPELFNEKEQFDEETGHNIIEVIAGIFIGLTTGILLPLILI